MSSRIWLPWRLQVVMHSRGFLRVLSLCRIRYLHCNMGQTPAKAGRAVILWLLAHPVAFIPALCRHSFEKRKMHPEQQSKAMRAALRRSLRSQWRLNKRADAAAIAAGFEPLSALSWTARFRWGCHV